MDVESQDDTDNGSRPTRMEYPEPDHVRRFPWLGEDQILVSETENAVHDEDSSQISSDPELVIWEANNDHYHSGHDEPDPTGQLTDPDYDYHEDSVLSDELISEAESDFHSLDISLKTVEHSENGRARGSGRGRGRGRGRGGEGRRGRGFRGGRGGKGIKRGPRKALEPSQEFKVLHSHATVAFIDHDYDLAEDFVQQAIAVNPEMFSAHSLLSEIHMARGDQNKALTALFHGVHTRPRDTQAWCKVAELILERALDDRSSGIRDAIYCYNRVIGADSTHVEARYSRAALNREIGNKSKAAYDYERLLKQLPHDTTVLRHIAEIYIELGEVERALRHYDHSISHYQSKEPHVVTSITWSDLNIYAELLSCLGDYSKGLQILKTLCRWLLGRKDDRIWDEFADDDREFDVEDLPRRAIAEEFVPGKFEAATYGEGLPLELRVKLGVFRLKLGRSYLVEAMNHFDWLSPGGNETDAILFEYPDLFREVADALRLQGYQSHALRFYEPLRQIDEHMDITYFLDSASCYRVQGLSSEAENCYNRILEKDGSNMEAHAQLAKLRTNACIREGQATYNMDVASISTNEQRPRKRVRHSTGIGPTIIRGPSALRLASKLTAGRGRIIITSPASRLLAPHSVSRMESMSVSEKEAQEKAQLENIQILYLHMRGFKERLRKGITSAKAEWMNNAKVLIEDFRNNRVFFPFDKQVKFYGYTKEARARSLRSNASLEMEEMASTVQQVQRGRADPTTPIPTAYRGVEFDHWLDTLLEYAIFLAQDNHPRAAYEIISLACEANIFYHSSDSLFLIHVSWFACALILDDKETLCNVARYFMKEYQFVTDSYRLYSTLNRLCDGLSSWYNSGPSQKFVLRQVKAMDFSFIGHTRRKSLYQERASYTMKDELGNPLHAEDMDVGLIMLYGHILYAGTSYSYALNYFFRAYAVDPSNPIVNLSLALGYIHYALKRQSKNRHFHIMQGFSFLFAYYDLRQASSCPSERQEAEFNVARAYHTLGLLHLAIPYYEQCLALSAAVQTENSQGSPENYACDAAFALQGIWAASGQLEMANAVTNRWLKL